MTNPTPPRRLGSTGPKDFPLSLGCDPTLSAEEMARVEQAVPASEVAGTRYDEHQMRMLDSERR